MVTVNRRAVEITKDTTLNGGTHDGAILVCSRPVTLTPAFVDMGSSFTCTIVNLSCGRVTFAPGITTSNGFRTLPTGQLAQVHAFTYLGGQRRVRRDGGRRHDLGTSRSGHTRYGCCHCVEQCRIVMASTNVRRRDEQLCSQLPPDKRRRCLDFSECDRAKPHDRQSGGGYNVRFPGHGRKCHRQWSGEFDRKLGNNELGSDASHKLTVAPCFDAAGHLNETWQVVHSKLLAEQMRSHRASIAAARPVDPADPPAPRSRPTD